MTLEQLVTDLATSQRLRDAGFPQDTAMVWYHVPACEPKAQYQVNTRNAEYYTRVKILCAAPTSGELEEWLFAKYPFVTIVFSYDDRGCYVKIGDRGYQKKESLAALAALLLEVAG